MRIYNQEELKEIHHQSMFNKVKLDETSLCGCFYCKEIMPVTEITEWTDRARTAICPYCGIDSIHPDSEKYPLTETLLDQLYKMYFDNPQPL